MKHWFVALSCLGLVMLGPSQAKASLFVFGSNTANLDLNLAIPDQNTTGVNVSIDTASGIYGPVINPGTEKIVDVSLFLNLTHPWMGDLSASLSFGGKKLVVMARPQETSGLDPLEQLGSPFGDGSNFNASWLGFSDFYLGNPETLGFALGPNDSPPGPVELFPNPDNFASDYSTFAGFFDQDPSGVWTINLKDWAAGDFGHLNAWELDILTEHIGSTPEPASLMLLGAGLAAAGARFRNRRRT